MTRFLPILPLRDIVVFPQRIVPLFVGREKSVAALEAAMAADRELFLVAQLDPGEDDPDRDALYDLGVIATAMQMLKLPDGTVRVLVEGARRARLIDMVPRDGYMTAEVEEVTDETGDGPETQALMRSVIDQFENYAKLNKRLPPETGIMSEISAPSFARVQTRSDPPSAAARSRIDQGADVGARKPSASMLPLPFTKPFPLSRTTKYTCDGRAASFTTACVARPWRTALCSASRTICVIS